MKHYSLSDIYVGMKEVFSVKITEETQNTFTELSGDINPMHLDKDICVSGGTKISWYMEWLQLHITLHW